MARIIKQERGFTKPVAYLVHFSGVMIFITFLVMGIYTFTLPLGLTFWGCVVGVIVSLWMIFSPVYSNSDLWRE